MRKLLGYTRAIMPSLCFSVRAALVAAGFALIAAPAEAGPRENHVLRQITNLTEGSIWQPRVRQLRGEFVSFVSDGDVLGPGTAHIGNREIYLWDEEAGTTVRVTDSGAGESWDASRLTDDFRTKRLPIITFVSNADHDPSVGNADGNPEIFLWVRDEDRFIQITDTQAPVVNAAPFPSDTGRCIVFESTGNYDNNNGENTNIPPFNRSNEDGSQEVFFVDFESKDYAEFRFTQMSDGPVGTTSEYGSAGGFFFPGQCESITFQSDHDQLGLGITGINTYLYKRKRPKLELASENLGPGSGDSIEPTMSGTGVSAGGPSVVWSSNNDLWNNGSTGYEIFKRTTQVSKLRQFTDADSGDTRSPVVSDGGGRIGAQTTSELIDSSRKVVQGGPGPFNADGNNEIVRLDGKRRVRQLSRSTGCENTFPTIAGNGRTVAWHSTCDLIPGSNPTADEQIFVYRELKGKDTLSTAAGCSVAAGCCNVANGCYTEILGRGPKVGRRNDLDRGKNKK